MKTMKHEQFTQIDLDEMDDIAVITTNSPTCVKQLNGLCRVDENVKFISEPCPGYTRMYTVPKEYISIRRPRNFETVQRRYSYHEIMEAAKLFHEKRKGNQ